MNISYMGTPDFAVPCLEALHQSHHSIAAVITAPDKPAGRGRSPQASPVKKKALELGLHVHQPTNLKSPEFVDFFHGLGLDLNVVVAFRMLPEVIWSAPRLGTINLHASLLPAFRGAAPIQWAIARGAEKTGLSTFRLAHAIDTGDVLLQKEIALNGTETGSSLYTEMMQLGPSLLLETLDLLESGKFKATSQNELAKLPYRSPSEAPKLEKAHGSLSPDFSVNEAERYIRAFYPFPGCRLQLLMDDNSTLELKVHAADCMYSPNLLPGALKVENGDLMLGFKDGVLRLTQVQAPGKKAMPASDFLRGLRNRPVRWQKSSI